MMLFKYSVLYSRPNQPKGVLEQVSGAVRAFDFPGALQRVLNYYNNYIITSIKLVAIDDIIEVDDIEEI